MGFQFGILGALSPEIGMISFVVVVAFLIFFESITTTIDYLRDYYPASYQMIQKVYKELMIMGVVSFSVVMFESQAHITYDHEWIIAIDFVHILLFFTALFYVVHACFLISLSFYMSNQNDQIHYMQIKDILVKIKETTGYWDRLLYENKYIPGSNLRKIVEFKIIHALFRDTYSLPLSFNYSCYLKGCHEKYSLEILEVGVFNWMFLILIGGVNIARIFAQDALDIPCDNYELNHRHQRSLEYISQPFFHRILSSSTYLGTDPCPRRTLVDFQVSGFVLILWAVLVLVFSRIYELRLIAYAGVNLVGDYEALLRRQMAEDDRRMKIQEQVINGEAKHHEVVSPFQKKKLKKEISLKSLKHNIDMLQNEENTKKVEYARRIYRLMFFIQEMFFECCRAVVYYPSQFSARTFLSSVKSDSEHGGGGVVGVGGRKKMLARWSLQSTMNLKKRRGSRGSVANISIKKHEDFSEIYFFKSKKIFFR